MGRKDLFARSERGQNRLRTPHVSRETGVASVVNVGSAGSVGEDSQGKIAGEERRGWQDDLDRDGKASGWPLNSFTTSEYNPERSGCAPPPIAAAAEVRSQGGIPVKKIAVRVATMGGGIVAILLAGGAHVKFN
jgi:hypothetical protein